jgi:hypothetical protein
MKLIRNLFATPWTSKAPGAIAQTVDTMLENLVSLRSFGAKGDRKTDDSAAILTWLTYLMATGERGSVPAGTYYMDEPLTVLVTGNLDVRASANAVFVGSAGISQNMILLLASAATSEQFEVSWRGGGFDISQTEYVPATLSGSGLALQWVWKSTVSGVKFIGPADYTQGGSYGGDTGLTLVSCQYINVKGNFFSGIRDTGIYITGDSNTADDDNDGRDIVVANNHFSKCAGGVSVKRQSHRTLVGNNVFDYCEVGVALVTTDVVKPDPPAGGGAIIVGNSFSHTARNAIDLRYSNVGGTMIVGNRIQDFGYGLDGVTPSTSQTAILFEGASDSFVQGNWIGMQDWAAGGSHCGVVMQDFTYAGVTYNSQNNNCLGNRLKGLDIGFRETPGQAGNNSYALNQFVSVAQQYNNIQATSTTLDQDAGSWAVVLYDAANGGNASPTTTTGTYVKTGTVVTATFSLSNINTAGMTAANPLYIGLPFAANPAAGAGACGPIVTSNVTFPAGRTSPAMTLPAGQQRALITVSGTGVAENSVTVSDVTSGSGSIVQASITYPTAS